MSVNRKVTVPLGSSVTRPPARPDEIVRLFSPIEQEQLPRTRVQCSYFVPRGACRARLNRTCNAGSLASCHARKALHEPSFQPATSGVRAAVVTQLVTQRHEGGAVESAARR